MHARTLVVVLIACAWTSVARAQSQPEPLPHAAATAHPERPVILAYYRETDLAQILAAARSHSIGAQIPLYCGTYGISQKDSLEVHKLPHARYAPVFTLVRAKDSSWEGRAGSENAAPISTRTANSDASAVAAREAGFSQALEGTEAPRALESASEVDAPLADTGEDEVVGEAALADVGLGAFGEDAADPVHPRAVKRELTGPVPEPAAFAKLPAGERFDWAVELGRRFRDEIRRERRAGVEVDTWQLDEISPSAADPIKGPAVRLFVRGVLVGLFQGRRELGDRPLPGIVYISNTAFQLGRRPLTKEMSVLWETVDRTCVGLVGEEYPTFRGDPAVAAEEEARLQLGLEKLGGPAARVAAKYFAGNSPGYILGEFLGGDVKDWPRARVNMWRTAYLEARARQGVAGFGEYDFLKANEAPDVFRDTFSSIEATETSTR